MYYIKGDYIQAKTQCLEALAIARDDSKFTYETVMKAKEPVKEIQSIIDKCEAKIKRVSLIDIRSE